MFSFCMGSLPGMYDYLSEWPLTWLVILQLGVMKPPPMVCCCGTALIADDEGSIIMAGI